MLSVRNLVVDIHESRILRQVSFEVGRGELVCLVGRNGAGKTTTFRTIMGLIRPVGGDVVFQGQNLVGWRTPRVARAGIGYAPEESGIFGALTVEENIELPTWTRKTARSAADRIALAYQVFPKLAAYRKRGGQQLSGGERKMVSIARALALDPELLLLDEPFEGLSPAIIPTVAQGIASIRESGRSVLLAESNFYHLPEDADRLVVLERGEVVFDGLPADALRDPAVARVTGVEAMPPLRRDEAAVALSRCQRWSAASCCPTSLPCRARTPALVGAPRPRRQGGRRAAPRPVGSAPSPHRSTRNQWSTVGQRRSADRVVVRPPLPARHPVPALPRRFSSSTSWFGPLGEKGRDGAVEKSHLALAHSTGGQMTLGRGDFHPARTGDERRGAPCLLHRVVEI